MLGLLLWLFFICVDLSHNDAFRAIRSSTCNAILIFSYCPFSSAHQQRSAMHYYPGGKLIHLQPDNRQFISALEISPATARLYRLFFGNVRATIAHRRWAKYCMGAEIFNFSAL